MKMPSMDKYSSLIKRLDGALTGEEIDDVIPALVSFTAMAGLFGEVEKKTMLSFFADTLDRIYEHQD
jgi:hypothetical protein